MQLTSSGYSRLDHFVAQRRGSVFALAALIGAMASVFVLDRMTELPHIQHLYYFPIIFAAITGGMFTGAATAGVAMLLYLVANPHALSWRYEESDVLQIAVFLAVGLVAARLAEDARRLHRLAMTDDLTGLHNLRSFEVELRRLLQLSRSTRTALSVLVIDVDRLKGLNDQHGHLTGAEAVRTVGRIIAEYIPVEGVACRYGGDEFVIAIPRCPESRGRRLANDLRRAVRATAPMLARVQFPEGTLSISIGVACRTFRPSGAPVGFASADDAEGEALFRAADRALYAAKRGGRDRVHTVADSVASQAAPQS